MTDREISKSEILKYLQSDDLTLIVKDKTESTNTDLKELMRKASKDKTVIIAKEQTAGRGRRGRSFHSPKNKGVYLSIYLNAEGNFTAFTSAAAVGVCNAIKKCVGAEPRIKWVNDILYDGKKLCGILCEGITDRKSQKIKGVVIGIGINCFKQEFPDEIKDIATTLEEISGDFSINKFIAILIDELKRIGYNVENGLFAKPYRELSCVIGKEVVLSDTGERVKVITTDDEGGLVVMDECGKIKTQKTGEVSIKII